MWVEQFLCILTKTIQQIDVKSKALVKIFGTEHEAVSTWDIYFWVGFWLAFDAKYLVTVNRSWQLKAKINMPKLPQITSQAVA